MISTWGVLLQRRKGTHFHNPTRTSTIQRHPKQQEHKTNGGSISEAATKWFALRPPTEFTAEARFKPETSLFVAQYLSRQATPAFIDCMLLL
ncbi:Hypothetical predicted protein [Podarcis lilfordi]|uniref:Uncharacterized protein n=1 Tax=Podarcis lilfordi TaxID=74358 RepID=A0AA35JNS0_9SAUR|nr:Hypothetical predicted protein [Podarcis lilfordi]